MLYVEGPIRPARSAPSVNYHRLAGDPQYRHLPAQRWVGNAEECIRGRASVLLPPATLAAGNGRAPRYRRAPQGGCYLGEGPPLPCPPSFGLGKTPP